MRNLIAILTVAILVAVPCRLWAEEAPSGSGSGERLQDLKLTDAQESRIAEIRKEARPQIQEAAKELATAVKEEMEKVRAVLTADQRTKLAELKEERREHRGECMAHRTAHLKELDLTDAEMARIGEIRKEFRPRVVKALEGLHGILTDEQRKAREEGLKSGLKRKEVIASLKLTDEQKEKVENIAKEVSTVVREEMQQIRDVLNESQKEKLGELKEERRERVRDRRAHRIANLRELDLTDEQKTKLHEIRQEFRPKVHEAGNKLRASIREELDKILAVLKGD
jgi:Spy/CpxP family protein refolding chaperone